MKEDDELFLTRIFVGIITVIIILTSQGKSMYSYFIAITIAFAVIIIFFACIILHDDGRTEFKERLGAAGAMLFCFGIAYAIFAGLLYHRNIAEVGYIDINHYDGTTTLSFKSALSIKKSTIQINNEPNPPLKTLIEKVTDTDELKEISDLFLTANCVKTLGNWQRMLNGYPSEVDGNFHHLQCPIYSFKSNLDKFIDRSFFSDSMVETLSVYIFRDGKEAIDNYQLID
jgi:hypothetical protein